MTSIFSHVESAPKIEVFVLNEIYKQDPFPQKVNLAMGAYRTDEGKPWVLPVVRKVEKDIAKDETLNHEYLNQLGSEELSRAAVRLVLGDDSPAIKENRVCGVQTLSGTGSLRLGADFLVHCGHFKTFYVSQPTWSNHTLVFKHAGFENAKTYRYWDAKNRALNIDGMIEDLKNAPPDSVIILHACAHNPTGIDPTQEQWKRIADVMEERRLFPFFDCAYQGFATGDTERDAWAVRYFIQRGFELLVAQSFAKNFGLYNERVGNLTIVVKDHRILPNIRGQIAILVRGNYSNPPCHGARIVSRVMEDKQLMEEWKDHIKVMSDRIRSMRVALRKRLEELGTPGTWEHITTQIGMFSYTGLTEPQVQYLLEKFHIYGPKDGRISICGLTTRNLEYVAKAINEAVIKVPNNHKKPANL